MTDQRYPKNLVVTADDFRDSGWKATLAGSAKDDYPSMWQSLSEAASKAMDDGRAAQAKVLWLLADACSMVLSPGSPNQPFKPYMSIQGRRSAIPEDFAADDLAFFASILGQIDNAQLQARISDLLWVLGKPRDVTYAVAAIDAYRRAGLDTESLLRGGRDCWERAIALARMLKGGAGTRQTDIESAIISAFDGATHADGYLALWLADLLRLTGVSSPQRPAQVSSHLEHIARHFDINGDFYRARDFYTAACEWFKASGNDAKVTEMRVAIAEGWVKEAIARSTGEQASHMVASSFYENAIQMYRTIPRAERAAYRVEERMDELRTRLSESGEKSLGEMSVISTPGTNITELIANARAAVQGKPMQDALLSFGQIYRGASAATLRKNALHQLSQFSMQSLFGRTVISRDGRVIAKRPAMNMSGVPSEDDEVVIRFEMIRHHGLLASLVVQADILPALEVLQAEHRLREADFVNLARISPIVPPGREYQFGKALYMGYEGDFVAAIYLLVPQVEHLVRFHLKQAGATTTNLDINGIENEYGLSTLIDLPEAVRVFGEDLAFEIRAIFTDAFGPNLRNELAHGLMDDEAVQSAFAIYSWWFALRLTLLAWWNAARKDESAQTSPEQTGDENAGESGGLVAGEEH